MKLLRTAAIAALALAGGYAIAQVVVPPLVQSLNPATDLMQVVPNGVPQAQSQYTHPQNVSGAIGYQNLGAATTGNTYTFLSGQKLIFMAPSGTLAAVTLVTEANPADGQVECFVSTHISTALTWTANTGQTMGPTITAGAANTPICLIYDKPLATWEAPNATPGLFD